MYRIILPSLLAISIQGCSAFDVLSALMPSSSSNSCTQVQTEANLGKTDIKALSSTVQKSTQEIENNNGEAIAGNKQKQSLQAINNNHCWFGCLVIDIDSTPVLDCT